MKRLYYNILRLVLVIAPLLLALHQVRAQADTVLMGGTSEWSIDEFPDVNYVWDLYNDVDNINFATDPGNCPATECYFEGGVNTGPTVNVVCLEPGTYFIRVMATSSCPANNLKVGKIVVVPSLSFAEFVEPPPVCQGDTALMTIVISGAPGPWEVNFTDGISTWTILVPESPYTFPLIPTPDVPGSYAYWITSVMNAFGIINETPSAPVMLFVKPKPVTSPIYRY